MESQKTFLVTPMSNSFSLHATEKATGSVTIINPADSSANYTYKVYVAPYSVVGTEYEADLTTQSAQTRISEWITIDEPEGVVKPNESAEVSYTISVPAEAPGGGQYAAIVVQATPEGSASAVQSLYEMASIVYADIAGKTVHSGAILSNEVPSFSTDSDIAISSTFENSGNVHEYASFIINVSNFLDGEEIYSSEDEEKNKVSEVIMPGSERHLSRQINNLPSLGIVTIEQTISYMGETSSVSKQVLICPIWFIVLLALTLGALVGTIITMAQRRRKQKSFREK